MKRTLGVCYYPEHWPESRWAEDAARMAEAGLTWVRIGEFAWSRMEPTPGELRLDWLDRAIATLGEAGLKVVLGTPTATPPRWMIDRHPDMLAVDADGRPRKFGSRRHYCFSHPGYREECARIVEILARRYGANPHVAAWQTDNEYGCHDTTLSYSEAARQGFRGWLADRYGQIDSLNAAWGNVFWSMDYRTYSEIDLPNLTVTEANPAHVLDFRRYSSDQVAEFNRLQVDIIRAHSEAPIAHNYMGRVLSFDHFDVGADLDIASWDSYPLGFLEDRSDRDEAFKARFMRQGDPDNQAFHHDLYRAVGKGRWWVMEQQPGPVNWAPYNPAPLPGMVRLWTWEAFAHGAEAVCYFRWRQAPFAQEQMHAGLLRPDSESAPALAEALQVAAEIGNAQVADVPRDAAIVFNYESAWAWEVQPQGRDFDYFRLVFDTYRALRQLGLNIDFLPAATDSLEGYGLVCVPGLMTWTEALKSALDRFHGIAMIGPRTGSKTKAMSIPDDLPPDWDRLSLKVARVESLRPETSESLSGGGTFRRWVETCETRDGAEVTETWGDGNPAVITAGNLRYLAGWPDEAAMVRLLGDAAREAGLKVLDLPDNLRRRRTAEGVYWFNYGAETVRAGAAPGIDRDIPPADLLRP